MFKSRYSEIRQKRETCLYSRAVHANCSVNPSITEWVQNVSMLGLSFNSSLWYIATILPVFLFVLLKSCDTRLSLCSDYIVVFRMLYVFCRIRLEHFLPVLLLIAQEPRREKVIGNATSAQNGCARSTLSRQVKITCNNCI